MGGLTPVACRLIVTRADTNDTLENHSELSVGICDGTTEFCVSTNSEYGQAKVDSAWRQKTADSLILHQTPGTSTITDEATFTSFITNGIRINWTTRGSNTYLITAEFWAGSDITAEVIVADIDPGQDLTEAVSVSSEPDLVYCVGVGTTTAFGSYGRIGCGWVHNGVSVTQAASGQYYTHNTVDVDNNAIVSASRSLIIPSGSAAEWVGISLQDFTGSDFDVYQHTSTDPSNVGFLCLTVANHSVAVKQISAPTSASTDWAYTGFGFKPQYVSLELNFITANDTGDEGSRAGPCGTAIFTNQASNNQYCQTIGDEDAAADTIAWSYSADQAIYLLWGTASMGTGAGATNGYDLTSPSFTSTGFTFSSANITAVNSTAALWVGVAIEEETAGATLSPANCTHSHSADAGTLIQNHKLSAANCSHAHSADAATLTQNYILGVQNCTHAHSAENATLAYQHNLVTAAASHAHAADNATLAYQHNLASANCSHAHAADNATLTVSGAVVLSPENTSHAHSAQATTLTINYQLQIAGASHAHSATAATLLVNHKLQTQNTSHAHSAQNTTLTVGLSVGGDNCTHAHTAQNATLSQNHYLGIDNAVHAHSAQNATLQVGAGLVGQNTTHAHSAQAATLTQNHYLSADNCSHAHTATVATLTQNHKLAAADATHAHSATAGQLLVGAGIAADDTTHAHTADNATLAQSQYLAVDSCTHSHSATSPTLSEALYLVVDNTSHVHSSQVATLDVGEFVAANDASHGLSSTTASLYQIHALSIANATHSITETARSITPRGGGFVEGSTSTRAAVGYTAITNTPKVAATITVNDEAA